MRNVVVGVAATGRPEPALEVALQEAVLRGLPLAVVHGLGLPADPAGPLTRALSGNLGPRAVAEQRLRAALARARYRVRDGLAADVEVLVVDDDAVSALLRAAGSAALLVLASPPTRSWSRSLLGSAACLQRVFAPVMVVPDAPAPPAGRILVGVDGGPCSLSALAWAVAQASERALPLVVVGVCRASDRVPEALALVHADPRTALRLLLQQAGWRDTPAQVLVRVGDAAEVLGSAVTAQDQLVVGSRGQDGGLSLLLGSTSARLVQTARCPTVVVRAGQARRELHRVPPVGRPAGVARSGTLLEVDQS